MLYMIHAVDRPGSGDLRLRLRPEHLEYLNAAPPVHAGPLLDEEGGMCGSLILIDVPDRAAAEAYAAGDPFNREGLFERVEVCAHRASFGPLAPT